MNYGGSEIKNFDGGTVSIEVGIQKIFLKEILFESAKTDGTGDKVLTIVFIDNNGAEEKLRIWKLNEDVIKSSPIVGQPIKYKSVIMYGGKEYKFEEGKQLTSELALVRAYYDLDVKVKHIISKFTNDTDLTNVTSYETFAKAVKEKLKDFYGIEIEGLFEYDKKNYVHLYSKIPFLQKVGDVVLRKSLLKAKLIKDVVEPTNDDLPVTNNTIDDLPF